MNYKIVFLSLVICHQLRGMEQELAPGIGGFSIIASAISHHNNDELADYLQSDPARQLTLEMRELLSETAKKELLHSQQILIEKVEEWDAQQDNQLKLLLCQQAQAIMEQQRIVYDCLLAYKYFENLKFPQAIFNPSPRQAGPRLTLDNHLNALIDNERQSIYACVFHFTLYNVAKQLVEAKKRNVDVQMVINYKQADRNPVLHALNQLVSNDISIHSNIGNNGFETNHQKFILFGTNIFRSPLLWVGSYNITGHSNLNSWEDVTVLNDSRVIAQYLKRFNEMRQETTSLTLEMLKREQDRSNPSHFSLHNNNVPQGYFDNAGVFKEGSRH